jgi:hypothetical protein
VRCKPPWVRIPLPPLVRGNYCRLAGLRDSAPSTIVSANFCCPIRVAIGPSGLVLSQGPAPNSFEMTHWDADAFPICPRERTLSVLRRLPSPSGRVVTPPASMLRISMGIPTSRTRSAPLPLLNLGSFHLHVHRYVLADPKGSYHFAGGWVDDGVSVDYYGWNRLVAVSYGADEGGCVGICPDVDLVYGEMMPSQGKAHPQAEHAARSPIQRDLWSGVGRLGGTLHGNQSTTVSGLVPWRLRKSRLRPLTPLP